jgi:hypothetical protein
MSAGDTIFQRALVKLLDEIFSGPPGSEAYLLNPGDPGLLRQLDSIDAVSASARPMPGKTTIAAHVDHVYFGLSLLNRWAKALADEIEMRPCPTCGLYQPEMIGERRRSALWAIFWLAAAAFLTLFILGAVGLWENQIPFYLALAGMLFAACMWLVSNSKPNRNLDKNLDKGARYIEEGTLQLVEAQDRHDEPPPDKKGTGFMVAALFCLVGILAMPAAEWLRMVNGWPVNAAWAPVVAGPGDAPWTYFQQRLACVKGYWNGNGMAVVTNAGELGLANPRLAVSARDDDWGNSISAKSSESKSNKRLWARVHVPEGANLAGKTLKLKIMLNVHYPMPMGNKQFVNHNDTFEHSAELALAGPAAGALYVKLWWLGGVGGALLVLLCCLCFIAAAKGYRDQGLEARIVQDQPGPSNP